MTDTSNVNDKEFFVMVSPENLEIISSEIKAMIHSLDTIDISTRNSRCSPVSGYSNNTLSDLDRIEYVSAKIRRRCDYVGKILRGILHE